VIFVTDASIMVAVFHEADRFHHESRAWLRDRLRARDTLLAPVLLLSEVAGALARRTGDPGLGLTTAQRLEALRAPADEHGRAPEP
jgi:predicted nucleic acid-binding protein